MDLLFSPYRYSYQQTLSLLSVTCSYSCHYVKERYSCLIHPGAPFGIEPVLAKWGRKRWIGYRKVSYPLYLEEDPQGGSQW